MTVALRRPADSRRRRRTRDAGMRASTRSARAAPRSCARRRVAGAAVRAHRGDRIDAHRGRCRRDARVLGVRPGRARAGVDRRGARAARRAAACGARARASTFVDRRARSRRSRGRASAGTLTLADGARIRTAGWSSAPTGSIRGCAQRGGHRRRAEALRRRRRSSPISSASARITAARGSGSATTAACWRGCRCPGGGSRSSGRRPTRWRRSCWRCAHEALAERVADAGGNVLGRSAHDHAAGRISAAIAAAADVRRPSAGARRRRRARRAPAGRAGC